MQSIEIKQQRAKVVADMRAILDKAKTENRELTTDEVAKWSALDAEADALWAKVELHQRQETLDRELAETRDVTRQISRDTGTPDGASVDPAENDALSSQAFEIFLRAGARGVAALPDNLRNSLRRPEQRVMAECFNSLPKEVRQQTVTDTAGGYLIPRAFQRELDVALLAFGGMRQAARIVTTADGATMDWPTVNDTGTTGELLGINTQVNVADLVYATVPFEAYKYSSKAVLVPVELMQDAFFDMTGHVNSMLGERLGRITNTHLTTGTGSSQPKGAVIAAVDSGAYMDISNAATAAENYLVVDQMQDCVHSVKAPYRVGASWMFADSTLKVLKKLKDGDQRPIFDKGGSAPGADPPTILGYPYTINDDVPAMASTNKCVLFGNFKKYIIRNVRPMVMLRLTERYADYHQVGYFGFERLDGDLVDAGTNPLKYMDTQA